MPEYLIRTKETRKWPEGRNDELASTLMPNAFACTRTEGLDDFQLECEGSTITFSAEEVGWQVSVGAPMREDDADALIAVVTEQIEVGPATAVSGRRSADRRPSPTDARVPE